MAISADQVRLQFEAEGLSVAEWARAHGYRVRTVRAVINGELQARRGISHEIAVALGLKDAPSKIRLQQRSAA